jgi:hypothetical protein
MKTFLLTTLLLFTFLGCSDTKTRPSFLLQLSNNGVASLNETLPFSQNKIAPYLLGYDIKLFSAFLSGKSQKILRVSYKGQEVMLITASKEPQEPHIQSIVITSDFIENPLHLVMHEMLDTKKFTTCHESKTFMACKNEKYPNITAHYFKNTSQEYLLQELVWQRQ